MMEDIAAPTIFDSFNARALDPAEVAETFVPSRHFDELIKRRHTLMVGPRGSGKTTLLKMLQQPALRQWGHSLADSYREKITFTGIFVPTDISWSVQLGSLGESLDESTRRLLSVSTFTTHVFRSLVRTFENRTPRTETKNPAYGFVQLSEETEAILCKHLSQSWDLGSGIPSLVALRWALSERLKTIFRIASQEATRGEQARKMRLAEVSFLHLHFLSGCSRAVEVYEDLTGTTPSKWAFLFDELELAPKWIQEELGSFLRSTDPRFLFKLALNPFTENNSILEAAEDGLPESPRPMPAPDQDFDQIPLWYVGKIKAYQFCNQLWAEMLSQRDLRIVGAEKVFGDSYFTSSPKEWREVYRNGSKASKRFEELALKDHSFSIYLRRKGIDPSRLEALTDDRRAATVRKIGPLVAVREFYRRPEIRETPKGRLRSRKTSALYSGAESLFALTEGNPRWFIGIVQRLLDEMQENNEKRIRQQWQAEQVSSAAERFQAMLNTIPVPRSKSGSNSIGVLPLIEKIADYIHERLVRGPFTADPPTTFVVDAKTPDELLPSIGRAINAGAFIYVPDGEQIIIPSLPAIRGKRFRVSYLLAPLYGMPLQLGKAVRLSAILKSAVDSLPQPRTRSDVSEQLDLLISESE